MDLVAFGFVVYHYLRVYLLGRRALSFISIESIKSPDFVSFYIAFDMVIVDIARDWPMRSLSRDSLELHLSEIQRCRSEQRTLHSVPSLSLQLN